MLLKTQNIYKSFGDKSVLKNASINITDNSIVGLVGESGSGKTTLAKIIVGLETSDKGELRFQDESLSFKRSKQNRRDIQMMFQNALASFNPKFTIENNLKQPIIEHSPANTDIDYFIKKVGLDPELKHRYPHQLSGGQIQRMAFARAIIAEPKLIIADEPTSALDIKSKVQILSLIQSLKDQFKIGFLIITHDILSLRNISDHLYVMNQGNIVESGSPENILDNPQQPYTQKLIDAIPHLQA